MESDLAVNVEGMSLGSLSANSLTGFTNPTGLVFQNSNWTTSPTKYLSASDYRYLVMTSSSQLYRDQEVLTWCRKGTVLLRLVGGEAIYFTHNGESANGTLEIGLISGYTQGLGNFDMSGTQALLYTNSNLVGTVPGYSKTNTDGAVFEFGVSGFNIYAKFNGAEFVNFQDFRHVVPGAVGLQAESGYGYRDMAASLLVNVTLHSDPSHNIFDMRDLGMESLSAIGSMTASSNQLTLISNPGFSIGNQVVVEIGGESGAGMRGSIGVGGTWPSLSYATVGAMNADTGQTTNTYAWVTASGGTYQWDGMVWNAVDSANYYVAEAFPLSLVAHITNVVGNTLTLDHTAVVSTTSAKIYFDNAPALGLMLATAGAPLNTLVPSYVTVTIPIGKFAVSQGTTAFARQSWVVMGTDYNVSKLFAPKGTTGPTITFTQGSDNTVRNLAIIGNARDEGFALNVTQADVTQDGNYPRGVFFSSEANDNAIGIKATDVFQQAIGTSYTTNIWAYQSTASLTDGLRKYIQWQFLWADSAGGGYVDCGVSSPNLTGGFSMFRSTGIHNIRSYALNAAMESNSSGIFIIDSPTIVVEANSQYQDSPTPAFASSNPLININSNVSPPNPDIVFGGTISNPTITQLGYINNSNDVLVAITIGGANPNVTVRGTYPAYPGAVGTITSPNYASPSTLYGALGVRSDGAVNTIVNGIRVIGTSGNGYPNIQATGIGSSVTDCVADSIAATVQSNCLTNAQWNMMHP